MGNITSGLAAYYDRLEQCDRCASMPSLAAYQSIGLIRTPRMHPVPRSPKVLLVYETPGTASGGAARTGRLTPENDDQTARNLRRYLDAASLSSEDVAYANAVSCPAINSLSDRAEMRTPTSQEIRNCASHVLELARLLGVRYIGAAGKVAVRSLLGTAAFRMTDLYEEFLAGSLRGLDGGIRMAPLFHTSPLGIANIKRAAKALETPDLDVILWRRMGEYVREQRGR